MTPSVRPARLRAEAESLADLIEQVVPTESHGSDADAAARILRMLRHHLIARLADPDRPLLVAIFGPTGSGKSTITNSLAGRAVTTAGALRPTTRRAVVWTHHEGDGAHGVSHTGPVEVVVDDHPLLHTLVIVDTPDIDSVAEEHRRQTEAILDLCDVAVAVTTPQRYADAAARTLLLEAAGRVSALLVVMNRAARRAGASVPDLTAQLRGDRASGVRRTDDIVVIQEQRVRDGRLPKAAVSELRRRLEDIASDPSLVAESVQRSAERIADETDRLAHALRTRSDEVARLTEVVDEAVAAAARRIEGGPLLPATVVNALGSVGGRRGRRERRSEVGADAIVAEIGSLAARLASDAASSVREAWRSTAGGAAKLDAVGVEAWPESDRIRSDVRSTLAGEPGLAGSLLVEAVAASETDTDSTAVAATRRAIGDRLLEAVNAAVEPFREVLRGVAADVGAVEEMGEAAARLLRAARGVAG